MFTDLRKKQVRGQSKILKNKMDKQHLTVQTFTT